MVGIIIYYTINFQQSFEVMKKGKMQNLSTVTAHTVSTSQNWNLYLFQGRRLLIKLYAIRIGAT